jgi:hypothetical protein
MSSTSSKEPCTSTTKHTNNTETFLAPHTASARFIMRAISRPHRITVAKTRNIFTSNVECHIGALPSTWPEATVATTLHASQPHTWPTSARHQGDFPQSPRPPPQHPIPRKRHHGWPTWPTHLCISSATSRHVASDAGATTIDVIPR